MSGGYVEGDTHMELWRSEVAALEESPWEAWAKKAERLFGRDLDGEQSEDGYSLDGFYDLWKAGYTPERAVAVAYAGIVAIGGNVPDVDNLTGERTPEGHGK